MCEIFNGSLNNFKVWFNMELNAAIEGIMKGVFELVRKLRAGYSFVSYTHTL